MIPMNKVRSKCFPKYVTLNSVCENCELYEILCSCDIVNEFCHWDKIEQLVYVAMPKGMIFPDTTIPLQESYYF